MKIGFQNWSENVFSLFQPIRANKDFKVSYKCDAIWLKQYHSVFMMFAVTDFSSDIFPPRVQNVGRLSQINHFSASASREFPEMKKKIHCAASCMRALYTLNSVFEKEQSNLGKWNHLGWISAKSAEKKLKWVHRFRWCLGPNILGRKLMFTKTVTVSLNIMVQSYEQYIELLLFGKKNPSNWNMRN